MKLTVREKFLAKICVEPATGCWLWRGLVRPDGYGATRFEGKEHGAHRVAWRLFRGEIALGQVVCHKCDVRACVNPEHLFLGTVADNVHDMTRKGRSRRGMKHGSAKLNEDQVRRIKTMLAEDRLFMSEIAQEFGVSQTTIRAIKVGRTWRDVEAPAVTNTVMRGDESPS
jgi:HNH endonuclease